MIPFPKTSQNCMEKVLRLIVTKRAWLPGNIMVIPLPWVMILLRRKCVRLWRPMWKVGKMQRYRGNYKIDYRTKFWFLRWTLSFSFFQTHWNPLPPQYHNITPLLPNSPLSVCSHLIPMLPYILPNKLMTTACCIIIRN